MHLMQNLWDFELKTSGHKSKFGEFQAVGFRQCQAWLWADPYFRCICGRDCSRDCRRPHSSRDLVYPKLHIVDGEYALSRMHIPDHHRSTLPIVGMHNIRPTGHQKKLTVLEWQKFQKPHKLDSPSSALESGISNSNWSASVLHLI